MGTDAIGFSLALLVVGLSMVAVKVRNMLLTLGTAALWATLLAYILANTTAGENWQQLFILAVAAFLCAFALISFLGRNRQSSFTENIGGITSRDIREPPPPRVKRGLMDLDTTEYRAVIRARMRQPRRRR